MKCPNCKHLFWIGEAQVLGEEEPFRLGGVRWPGADDYEAPDENDYIKFADNEELPAERELYIRIRAWWSANDSHRRQVPHDDSVAGFSVEQEDNLIRLSDLLDEMIRPIGS